MTKKDSLERRLGNNAVDMMSRLIISSASNAIMELIANSYDADATQVTVNYDSDRKKLMIVDNGSGMDLEGLKGFYRVGDSEKLKEPISKLGRRKIGKFGVATTLLKYLGNSYKLSTIKDGKQISVSETFGKTLSEGTIPYFVKNVSKETPNGTSIFINGVNFEENNLFNLKEFTNEVKWKLPIMPDFKIKINNQNIEGKSIEDGKEFILEEEGKEMGKVSGSFYLTGRGTGQAGIHVYVNGRRIGDPKSLLSKIVNKHSLSRKLVGIINADSLEDAILFDRDRFREDHPSYLEFLKNIKKSVQEVRKYAELQNTESKVQRTIIQRPKLLEKVLQRMSKHNIEEICGNVELVHIDDENHLGRYNETLETLLLNTNHPMLKPNKNQNAAFYESNLQQALIEVIALDRAKSINNSTEIFATYESIKTMLWGLINGNSKELDSKIENPIFESLVYTVGELARLSKRNIGEIRDAISSGGIESLRKDQVVGENFKMFQEKTQGYTSLHSIAYEMGAGKNVQIYLDRYNKLFQDLNPEIINNVGINIGKDDKYCFYLKDTFVAKISEILKNGNSSLDKRSLNYNPNSLFSKLEINTSD